MAVLDSGIDYLHAALLGSGNPADFAANNPDIIEPGTFPTAKVVGGYDFVGSNWTGATGSPSEAPDPDPLDAGPGAVMARTSLTSSPVRAALHPALASMRSRSALPSLLPAPVSRCFREWTSSPTRIATATNERMDIINMSLGRPAGQPDREISPLP